MRLHFGIAGKTDAICGATPHPITARQEPYTRDREKFLARADRCEDCLAKLPPTADLTGRAFTIAWTLGAWDRGCRLWTRMEGDPHETASAATTYTLDREHGPIRWGAWAPSEAEEDAPIAHGEIALGGRSHAEAMALARARADAALAALFAPCRFLKLMPTAIPWRDRAHTNAWAAALRQANASGEEAADVFAAALVEATDRLTRLSELKADPLRFVVPPSETEIARLIAQERFTEADAGILARARDPRLTHEGPTVEATRDAVATVQPPQIRRDPETGTIWRVSHVAGATALLVTLDGLGSRTLALRTVAGWPIVGASRPARGLYEVRREGAWHAFEVVDADAASIRVEEDGERGALSFEQWAALVAAGDIRPKGGA